MVFLRGCALIALWFVVVVAAGAVIVFVLDAEVVQAAIFAAVGAAAFKGIDALTDSMPA